MGKTGGYRNHPLPFRFRELADVSWAIAYYLAVVAEGPGKGRARFDRKEIASRTFPVPIDETSGQITCEWEPLLSKLERRSPDLFESSRSLPGPEPPSPVPDRGGPGPRLGENPPDPEKRSRPGHATFKGNGHDIGFEG